eukprot:CAMPEP_0119496190 /NCGR_PEP_ID=MMETSP1344-20130328/19596_1 /TAXON_ID=236787 /ORGANISM="Florenciella parvula, Strain CCMP2471" /LENGTH=118 /DNA_ID=CAMNT_0007531847 /DNA_START=91 /DNA_END=443 /DNA_ORIENTATION=-
MNQGDQAHPARERVLLRMAPRTMNQGLGDQVRHSACQIGAAVLVGAAEGIETYAQSLHTRARVDDGVGGWRSAFQASMLTGAGEFLTFAAARFHPADDTNGGADGAGRGGAVVVVGGG